MTGTRPRIGKTTLICRLLKLFSGYAVIQVREVSFFTSIISEPEGEEANLLRNSGSSQVIDIRADPKDVTDAMDQALCLLPLQIEGIIIEGNFVYNSYQGDIVLFDLEMQDINEEEWKKFIVNLRGLIDSIKTQRLGY